MYSRPRRREIKTVIHSSFNVFFFIQTKLLNEDMLKKTILFALLPAATGLSTRMGLGFHCMCVAVGSTGGISQQPSLVFCLCTYLEGHNKFFLRGIKRGCGLRSL